LKETAAASPAWREGRAIANSMQPGAAERSRAEKDSAPGDPAC